MNPTKVWTILQALLLSQLRAAATARNVNSFIRRPRVLIFIDVVLFAIISGISYLVGKALASSESLNPVVAPLLRGALITLPALMLGIILVLGLVLEVSGGSAFAASDTINWLPVTAGEYVLGSVFSLIIYYSIAPVVIIAATFPVSYAFGLGSAWELMVVLSIFGLFVASCVLEILRAVLNRFSSSFYKRGGRGAIAARAVVGVLLIVMFQVLFYPTFYEHIIGAITSNLGPAWFIPILWSAVSVSALLDGNLSLAASFAFLFVALTAVMFFLAILARSRYWVPMPAAVRISNATYAPSSRSLLGGLFSPGQLAIARKDLRGLVRRREMLRFLALPVVFVVSSLVSASSGAFGGFEFFGFFIVTLTTLFVSIASIGSEGKAISNLFMLPLGVRDFIVGKGVTPVIFGGVFVLIFYLVVGLLSRFAAPYIAILIISALALVFEVTVFGLFLGMRFPIFSESARASFMSQSAGIIGFPVALVLMGFSITPLVYEAVFQAGLANIFLGFIVSIVVIGLLSIVILRMVVAQARKFLAELPGQV
jgi:hypothetical protein